MFMMGRGNLVRLRGETNQTIAALDSLGSSESCMVLIQLAPMVFKVIDAKEKDDAKQRPF